MNNNIFNDDKLQDINYKPNYDFAFKLNDISVKEALWLANIMSDAYELYEDNFDFERSDDNGFIIRFNIDPIYIPDNLLKKFISIYDFIKKNNANLFIMIDEKYNPFEYYFFLSIYKNIAEKNLHVKEINNYMKRNKYMRETKRWIEELKYETKANLFIEGYYISAKDSTVLITDTVSHSVVTDIAKIVDYPDYRLKDNQTYIIKTKTGLDMNLISPMLKEIKSDYTIRNTITGKSFIIIHDNQDNDDIIKEDFKKFFEMIMVSNKKYFDKIDQYVKKYDLLNKIDAIEPYYIKDCILWWKDLFIFTTPGNFKIDFIFRKIENIKEDIYDLKNSRTDIKTTELKMYISFYIALSDREVIDSMFTDYNVMDKFPEFKSPVEIKKTGFEVFLDLTMNIRDIISDMNKIIEFDKWFETEIYDKHKDEYK